MNKATIRQYSVSLTGWFAEAVPFREAGLDDVAKRLLLKFSGYGLRPPEIIQREGDRLFDYDVNFALFNRNASFRLTGEGFHVAFHYARDDKDAGIISDCLVGYVESLSARRIRESKLEAFVHASLASADARNIWLQELGPAGRNIPVGGCILYLPATDAFGEVRFLVDRSLVLPDGVFLNWAAPSTQALSLDLLNRASADFRRVTGNIGLEFGSV